MNEILKLTVSDTGSEPLTLEDAKTFLQELSSDRDDEITTLITVARKRLEKYTGLSLVDKDITLLATINAKIRLPYPSVDAITTFKRWNGTEFETNTNYENFGDWIYPLFTCDKVEIVYTTTATDEEDVLHDMKRVLVWLYENKGDEQDGMPTELFSNAARHKLYSWE